MVVEIGVYFHLVEYFQDSLFLVSPERVADIYEMQDNVCLMNVS